MILKRFQIGLFICSISLFLSSVAMEDTCTEQKLINYSCAGQMFSLPKGAALLSLSLKKSLESIPKDYTIKSSDHFELPSLLCPRATARIFDIFKKTYEKISLLQDENQRIQQARDLIVEDLLHHSHSCSEEERNKLFKAIEYFQPGVNRIVPVSWRNNHNSEEKGHMYDVVNSSFSSACPDVTTYVVIPYESARRVKVLETYQNLFVNFDTLPDDAQEDNLPPVVIPLPKSNLIYHSIIEAVLSSRNPFTQIRNLEKCLIQENPLAAIYFFQAADHLQWNAFLERTLTQAKEDGIENMINTTMSQMLDDLSLQKPVQQEKFEEYSKKFAEQWTKNNREYLKQENERIANQLNLIALSLLPNLYIVNSHALEPKCSCENKKWLISTKNDNNTHYLIACLGTHPDKKQCLSAWRYNNNNQSSARFSWAPSKNIPSFQIPYRLFMQNDQSSYSYVPNPNGQQISYTLFPLSPDSNTPLIKQLEENCQGNVRILNDDEEFCVVQHYNNVGNSTYKLCSFAGGWRNELFDLMWKTEIKGILQWHQEFNNWRQKLEDAKNNTKT